MLVTGEGAYRAVYNATKAGNYSLDVIDVSDGGHAVGSPFEVLVEAAQAYAPATLVWWDRQVRDVENPSIVKATPASALLSSPAVCR